MIWLCKQRRRIIDLVKLLPLGFLAIQFRMSQSSIVKKLDKARRRRITFWFAQLATCSQQQKFYRNCFGNLLYRFLRSVPFPHGVQESLSWLPAWPVPGLLTVTTDWGQDISSNLRIRGTRRRMRIRKTDDASIVFTSCATSCRSRKVNADRHLFNVELKENSSNEVKQQQQQQQQRLQDLKKNDSKLNPTATADHQGECKKQLSRLIRWKPTIEKGFPGLKLRRSAIAY